jgi:hypothetical protein
MTALPDIKNKIPPSPYNRLIGHSAILTVAGGMIRAMSLDFSDKNRELGPLYGRHIEEMCRRHDHALERAGASHAVIFSGAPRYAFLDDNTYPFRANPHFVGWAPLTRLPLSYIVYTPGDTPVLIYYQPHDYWHPVPGSPDGYWTSQFDISIFASSTRSKRRPAICRKAARRASLSVRSMTKATLSASSE